REDRGAFGAARRRAGGGRRPRPAHGHGRAPRAPARAPGPGKPVRAGGGRGGEGTPRGARRPAGRSRGQPGRAREAPQRADRDGRAAFRRHVRGRPRPLRKRDGDRLPRRRGTPAPHGGRGGRGGTRRRGRAPSCREAGAAALAPLRWREGARRDRLPVRALPRAAVPVLPPRRGRGRARRHEHRPLRRAPAPLLGPRAVRRDHAPEADDGGRRRALRRDHGRRGRLPGRLAQAAPGGGRGGERRLVLYRPAAFEPLTDEPWDEVRARDGIAAIVADADAAFDPDGLWPAHEWDGHNARLPLKNLYVGAAGVVWALDDLRRRGHAETSLDLSAIAIETLERWRAEPDYLAEELLPEPPESALLTGETGILLVACRLGHPLEDDLRRRIRANLAN